MGLTEHASKAVPDQLGSQEGEDGVTGLQQVTISDERNDSLPWSRTHIDSNAIE